MNCSLAGISNTGIFCSWFNTNTACLPTDSVFAAAGTTDAAAPGDYCSNFAAIEYMQWHRINQTELARCCITIILYLADVQ